MPSIPNPNLIKIVSRKKECKVKQEVYICKQQILWIFATATDVVFSYSQCRGLLPSISFLTLKPDCTFGNLDMWSGILNTLWNRDKVGEHHDSFGLRLKNFIISYNAKHI